MDDVDVDNINSLNEKIYKLYKIFKDSLRLIIEFKEFYMEIFVKNLECIYTLSNKDGYVNKNTHPFLFEEDSLFMSIFGENGVMNVLYNSEQEQLEKVTENIYIVYKSTENMVFQ